VLELEAPLVLDHLDERAHLRRPGLRVEILVVLEQNDDAPGDESAEHDQRTCDHPASTPPRAAVSLLRHGGRALRLIHAPTNVIGHDA
jgi:hypothetical protein